MTEVKELLLHCMASACEELVSQGTESRPSSNRLLEHLLQHEQRDRSER
ncbi:ATP-binding protein [Pseudomonas syringae pv. tagetis]